jgi:hypothetical protein
VSDYVTVETDEIVGDLGWRWTRARARVLARRMSAMRIPSPYGHMYRYEVRRVGFGRWRVVALQNRLVPKPGRG